jgi:hypothetical protein
MVLPGVSLVCGVGGLIVLMLAVLRRGKTTDDRGDSVSYPQARP